MTKSTTSDPQSVIVGSAIVLLVAVAYFSGLTIPFVGPDEPRYAQVAREMLESGDWITPTIGGHPWLEKPVLLYWLEIVSFKLFGVTEFTARLGPALCGLGTVAALWLLGRLVDDDRRTSNLIALIAASTLSIIAFSHGASFDIVVTFPITAALVSYFTFDRRQGKFPLAAFYFFVGLALLAKGLIGIVLPFGVIAFFHLLSRRLPHRAFFSSLLWGTVLTVAVAATWYLPMYLRHGWTFVDEFFIQHHFQRFTSNKYLHPQPFYFYLWVLPLMTLPWLPAFLAGLWSTFRKTFDRNVTTAGDPLMLYSLSWLIVPVAFFSFSGSKLPGYVLPAVPAAVISSFIFLRDRTSTSRMWRMVVTGVAVVTLLAATIALHTIVPRFAENESVKGLIDRAATLGYADDRVFSLHTISHSAEFYAAGRLLREPSGVQKKLYGPSELRTEMHRAGVKQALVLVPLEYLNQLTISSDVRSDVIADNGEVAIVGVHSEQ